MKKIKILILGLLMLFAFGITANENPVKDNSKYEIKARCEVAYKGFYAKGNCKKVMKALARYKELTQ
ncbi:MAG: hypothetical protein L3J74_09480 [Bacteroidales bacterium]|nr:hypothetical protein [Bacteroidales bacterium]